MELAPVALLAGVLSITSPCCLPLIPGYLSYISGVDAGSRHRGRVLGKAALFVAGFASVFTALGAKASLAGSWLLGSLPVLTKVAGAFVVYTRSCGKRIHVYLHGQPVDDPTNYEIQDGDNVVVAYGASGSFPTEPSDDVLRTSDAFMSKQRPGVASSVHPVLQWSRCESGVGRSAAAVRPLNTYRPDPGSSEW